jgi:hypothetical protein
VDPINYIKIESARHLSEIRISEKACRLQLCEKSAHLLRVFVSALAQTFAHSIRKKENGGEGAKTISPVGVWSALIFRCVTHTEMPLLQAGAQTHIPKEE